LMVLPLLGSGSREAILAWLVTAGWYVALTRRLRLVFAALLLVAVYVVSVPVVAPHLWARTGGVVSDMQFGGLWTAIAESQWAPGEGETDIEGKEQNILARLAFWKYGLGRFAESPLVGIGFGRCNDYDLRLTGLNGFVSLAFDGTRVLAPSSLHNSYIHGLCESGLAGVGLLMAIWAALYMRLTGARRHFGGLKDPRSFFVAAQGLIPFSMAAALTGHALAAPSLMIPVTTIIGMAVAYDRWLRSQVVTGPDAPEAGTTAVRVAPAGDPIR